MPHAVTHVLLTIIIVDLFRDHFKKQKTKLPLKYLFYGGVASLIPDLDIPVYWFFKGVLKLDVPWFHRTFSHSVFLPLALIFITIFLFKINRKWFNIMAIITFAIAFHILLDGIFGGVMLFYPFSKQLVGLQIGSLIDLKAIQAGMDAVILLAWLWHEQRFHKIKDFI